MPQIFQAAVQAGGDEYKCKICFGFLQGSLGLFVAEWRAGNISREMKTLRAERGRNSPDGE
jgi:hypothetical protein